MKEHTEKRRPRILAIDFSSNDIERLNNAGFYALRGSTGAIDIDRNRFLIPCAKQDIDILLFQCREDSFKDLEKRSKAEESVFDGPYFKAIIEELWARSGWSIFFVEPGFGPFDFFELGIYNVGVCQKEGRYNPVRSEMIRLQTRPNHEDYDKSHTPHFPLFKGLEYDTFDLKHFVDPIEKYQESAKWQVFSVAAWNNNDMVESWPISTKDSVPGALSILRIKTKKNDSPFLKVVSSVPEILPAGGGIIILPTFETKNIDVSLALIKGFISHMHPGIFSKPQNVWINDFEAFPILEKRDRIEKIRKESEKMVSAVEGEISQMENKYHWLKELLIAKNDEFKNAVLAALRFLEFNAEDIDSMLDEQQRKREDLQIKDNSEYFALVETKSTKRGASESFIADLQTHQAAYSRENKCPIPHGLLIVNHSCEMHPEKRYNFYVDNEVHDRLIDGDITAMDSYFLFAQCQKVLKSELSKEQARAILKGGPGVMILHNAG